MSDAMTSDDVADAFATLCKEGRFEEAGRHYWARDVVSIEARQGGPMARLEGVAAVSEKSRWWFEGHDLHRLETHGPYMNGDQFMLRFFVEATAKATGEHVQMEEIGLYTVRGGKVVEERFFSGLSPTRPT